MAKPGSLFHKKGKEETILAPSPGSHQTRQGKHLISGLFEQPAYRQFTILAAELGLHRRDILREALNDLFIKYGKPPVA